MLQLQFEAGEALVVLFVEKEGASDEELEADIVGD